MKCFQSHTNNNKWLRPTDHCLLYSSFNNLITQVIAGHMDGHISQASLWLCGPMTIFWPMECEWKEGMWLTSWSRPPVPLSFFPLVGMVNHMDQGNTSREGKATGLKKPSHSWMTSWVIVALHSRITYQLVLLSEREINFSISFKPLC